jgi:sugar phosphate permease
MGSERATRVRHFVVFLTTLVAVMLYLDRICLSLAARSIRDDQGLSDAAMDWLLSAFFWTYAIGQVPAGWLSDRYGVRLTLALYLAFWSAFTGWMGLAFGLASLLLLRLGCGLAEAGAYPAAASLLSVWVPPYRRGLASGIVSVGGRLGGAAAQILTGYLMVAFTASASSLLSPADLLDISSFARVPDPEKPLKPAEKEAALARKQIVDLLPLEARYILEQAGREKPGLRPTEKQAAVLAEALNGLLVQPDLSSHVKLEALDLRSPPDGLDSEAAERYNRHLLETAFPEGLREVAGPGWRPVMMLYGAVGLLIALVFWWQVRDRPRQHPDCNAAEVALIEAGRPATPASRPLTALPWRALLESVSLWLISIVSFFTNVGWVFIITKFPSYLKEVHNVGVVGRGWMAFCPIAVGIPGMLLGGWLTDRLKTAYGAWWGRSAFLAMSRFVVMGGFLACFWLETPWGVTLALAVVAMFTDLGTPVLWAYSQDVGGRHVGSVLGWGNMYGNLGGAVSPLLLGWIAVTWSWKIMFLTCAAAFLLAGLCSLFVNASRPVAPQEPQ